MELVSIADFLNLTKLSERALISMLENGELSVGVGPLGEVLVDLSKVTPELVARRSAQRNRAVTNEELVVLEEAIATEIIDSLSQIIEEAFELVDRWRSNKPDNPTE